MIPSLRSLHKVFVLKRPNVISSFPRILAQPVVRTPFSNFQIRKFSDANSVKDAEIVESIKTPVTLTSEKFYQQLNHLTSLFDKQNYTEFLELAQISAKELLQALSESYDKWSLASIGRFSEFWHEFTKVCVQLKRAGLLLQFETAYKAVINKFDDPELSATFYISYAQVHYILKNYLIAEGYLFRGKQLLQLLKQADISQSLIAERDRHYNYLYDFPILFTTLSLHIHNRNFEEAEKFLKEGFELVKDFTVTSPEDSFSMFKHGKVHDWIPFYQLQLEKARMYKVQSMHEDAVILMKKILSGLPEKKNKGFKELELDTMLQLSRCCSEMNDNIEAHRWAQKHLYLVDKSVSNLAWANSCKNLGVVLTQLMDFVGAVKHFKELERIAQDLNDPDLNEEVQSIARTMAEFKKGSAGMDAKNVDKIL